MLGMQPRDGGIIKKNFFGDVALIVLDWEGLKTEVKGGVASRLVEKHRGRNGQFFLSILVAYRLSILQGYFLKLPIAFKILLL